MKAPQSLPSLTTSSHMVDYFGFEYQSSFCKLNLIMLMVKTHGSYMYCFKVTLIYCKVTNLFCFSIIFKNRAKYMVT